VREWGEVRSLALRRWASAQLRLGRPKPVISRLRAERVGDFADEGLYKLLIDALGQVGREVEAEWTDSQADGRSSR
jgi:transcriptional activator